MKDYASMDATAMAAGVLNGELSPDDLLDAALAALEEANPRLNIATHICADKARQQIKDGLPRGPLCGVPYLLKDLGGPAKDIPSTFGSQLMAGAPAWGHDTAMVRFLREAGAVFIGRSNSGEFGVTLQCEPTFHGPTRNPYNPDHSVGGSSGGSAAAVAADIVPVAHATDGCGSIRVPASHCGVFGLKPTRARASMSPDAGESWASMATINCVSRTVRDSALVLDIIGKPVPGDPYSAPPKERSYVEETQRPVGRLRIGVWAGNGWTLDPEVRQGLADTVALCERLGHEVEEVSLPYDIEEAITHFVPVWSAQVWSIIKPRYDQLGREPDGWGLERFSWALAQRARMLTADDYAASVRFIHRTGRAFAPTFERLDVVLSPTVAAPPWKIGDITTERDDVEGYMRDLFARCPFTAPYNVSGQPAMSMPLYRSQAGLPFGMQFAASPGGEGLLYRLAAQLESGGLDDQFYGGGVADAAARFDRDHAGI